MEGTGLTGENGNSVNSGAGLDSVGSQNPKGQGLLQITGKVSQVKDFGCGALVIKDMEGFFNTIDNGLLGPEEKKLKRAGLIESGVVQRSEIEMRSNLVFESEADQTSGNDQQEHFFIGGPWFPCPSGTMTIFSWLMIAWIDVRVLLSWFLIC